MDVLQTGLGRRAIQGTSTNDAHWSLLGHSAGGLGDFGAIDKLDLRIPKAARLSEQLAFILSQDLGSMAFGTRLYQRRVELSHLGWALNLNLDNKKDGHHKLELLAVGKLKLTEIVQGIREVFEVDPLALEIMRVDAKVDTTDYSVTWFYENARVWQKRYSEEYGHFHAEHKTFESLYLGKRPSVFRIYDRLGYLRTTYLKLERALTNSQRAQTFEEFSGYGRDLATLTRVERQFGSDDIPASIETLCKLRTNAFELSPFKPMQFLARVISDESIDCLDGTQFLKAQALQRLLEKHGYQGARKILERKTSRNAMRLLDRIMNGMDTTFANTVPDLDAIYRDKVREQME